MIRINLLKSQQTRMPSAQARAARQALAPEIQGISDFPESVRNPRSNNPLWIFVLLLLAVAAGIGSYFVFQRSNSEKAMAQDEVPATPAAAIPAPASVPPSESFKVAVNGDANNAEDSNPEALAEQILPGYSKLKPSRQIALQYFSGTQLLRDLRNAAPPGVGFTRITFTPPGWFYVHGVASTEEDLRHFQNALASLPGTTLLQNQIQPVGEGGKSREFHFSGRIHYDTLSMNPPANRMPVVVKIKDALQGFLMAAQTLGIKMDSIQLQDSSVAEGLKCFHYRTGTRCDYSRLQALLEKLQQAQSTVGFQRVNLEARGDDTMAANLDLLVYAR